LCVKVIGKLVDDAPHTQHVSVLAWTSSDVLWEKRAGLVGFVNLLPHAEPSEGFDDAFLGAASIVVADGRRFAQTAAGWTLRELSRREPERVRVFVERYKAVMSSEALASAGRLLHD
jgi:3-methyladenine DNA glycosylase AlkD